MHIKKLLLMVVLLTDNFMFGQPAITNPIDYSDTLVRIYDRVITVNDFIQRSEYTLRPRYCRGETGNDKKIILNSLIAEKLLAIETQNDSLLLNNSAFQNFIKGRKEQVMRQILFQKEGVEKVVLDKKEISKFYSLVGRKYSVDYFSVEGEEASKKINDSLANNIPFERIFAAYYNQDSIPSKTIEWNPSDNSKVQKAIFSDSLEKDQIVGPILTDSNYYMVIRINGWTERVAITERDIRNRLNDVTEKLTMDFAVSNYSNFVNGLMKGKNVQFDKNTFVKLTNTAVQLYFVSKEKKKDAFTEIILKDSPQEKNEQINFSFDESLEKFNEEKFCTIGNETWLVRDLRKEMNTHPLVFRKQKISKDEFPEQLKFAFADLIRDKYLTEAAYKNGYDTLQSVLHYTSNWKDASLALYKKGIILNEIKNDSEDRYDNLYTSINNLIKKHSDNIEINTELFNKISITGIDLFALQTNVPYPVYVPSFPELTNKNSLDYGKKLEMTYLNKN